MVEWCSDRSDKSDRSSVRFPGPLLFPLRPLPFRALLFAGWTGVQRSARKDADMKIRTFKVREREQTLQGLVASRLELSNKKAKALIDTRDVLVNGKRVWMAKHPLKPGDNIEVRIRETSSQSRGIPILFEDRHYIVANKPPALLANGENSLEAKLRQQLGIPSLKAVHRIDRDTSGCLLMAKDSDALARAISLFKESVITKLYHAIVLGVPAVREQSIRTPIDNRKAVTDLKILDSTKTVSHLLLRIETGRTHLFVVALETPRLAEHHRQDNKIEDQ